MLSVSLCVSWLLYREEDNYLAPHISKLSGKDADRRGGGETRRHGDTETRRHGDTETRRRMDTPRQDLLKLFSLCRVLLAQSNGPTTQRNPDVALLLPPPATVLHEQGGFAVQESTKSMVRCTNPRQHTSLCSLGRRSMRQTVASPLDACWPA